MTITSTLSSKGQTTIPSFVRQVLEIDPGETLHWFVEIDESGIQSVRLTTATKKNIRSLRGIAAPYVKKYGSALKKLEEERDSWE